MADKGIIFSGPMVRALIEGRKTQTRRVLKPQPGDLDRPFQVDDGSWHVTDSQGAHMSPLRLPYAPGGRLWVREACATWIGSIQDAVYKATESAEEWAKLQHDARMGCWKMRSPIHMPRWASRITLTVTDVRVQRLQKITEADAKAEGCPPAIEFPHNKRRAFENLWNNLHGREAWDANPWVAAISFTVALRNIDAEQNGGGT